MKIRTCYVSNSSSSSFIIAGKEIGCINQVSHLDFGSGKMYFIFGDSFCDGVDLIELNEKLFNFFRLNVDHLRIADRPIIEAASIKYNVTDKEMEKAKAKCMICGEKDYHSTNTIKSAANYLGWEEE